MYVHDNCSARKMAHNLSYMTVIRKYKKIGINVPAQEIFIDNVDPYHL